MKKIPPFLLSALAGLLLFAAWPVSPLTFLIFIAFVPLLLLEQQCTRRKQFFGWTYISLLIWNGATTWWVCNSTLIGGIAAILANSLLMSIPWIGFFNVKRRMGERFGYAALILFWLVFEYIHLNWELSWPWLTLGNAFASHPEWVQWYEFTGTSGGSLWILLVNLLCFLLLREKLTGTTLSTGYMVSLLALLIMVPGLSRILTPESGPPQPPPAGVRAKPLPAVPNIVIVQPNIDPYEKFAPGNQEEELRKMIGLSESFIDSNTALVVWPETAISDQINEEEMRNTPSMAPVWGFLHRHPKVNLLTGVEGARLFDEETKTPNALRIPNSDQWVESYNSAALMDSNSFQLYHKSKFVPGVENLPSYLKFMSALFDKFGGTTGGYVGQSERTVLLTYNHSYRIAPSVCYESIYGEFMSRFVRNGADLIAIITNDGWWGKTPGYQQSENYARLRAIETRRWVVRSANTGISCFIDPAGNVIHPQPWDTAAVVKEDVPPETILTFYVQYGDLISKAAILLSALLILWNIVFIFRMRSKRG